MSRLLLGIDTGGTYTDVVVIDATAEGLSDRDAGESIIAAAKAPTTRDDLSIGIGRSLDRAIDAVDGFDPSAIGLCAISTTLATNAIVEGRGGRVALIMIGFDERDIERWTSGAGAGDASGSESGATDADAGGTIVIAIDGGHTANGVERTALDLDTLRAEAAALPADVVGFAVVAQFAVRNPEHERAARELLSDAGVPVTCSHELTSKLNGPKRALTCVLNARLVGLIDDLLRSTADLLAARSINAPTMVVRGDGSLVSIDFARRRPIETILSGPAASLVGAGYLAGLSDGDAIVSDIGGTTTDVAILRSGRPEIDRDGAIVGGKQTMVEAVAMRTTGLGGDSEIGVDDASRTTRLVLGPRRVVPVSMLAAEHPELVGSALTAQLARHTARDLDGTFARLTRPIEDSLLDTFGSFGREVVDGLTLGPVALVDLLPTRRHELALDDLVARGLAQRCAITPTDAAVALGVHRGVGGEERFDPGPAGDALSLFARRKDRHGALLAEGPVQLAQRIVDSLVEESATAVLRAVFPADGFAPSDASGPVTDAGLRRHRGLVSVDVELTAPLIAVGASAGVYYPRVAELINGRAVVPGNADVANAVGAVVGFVRMSGEAAVTPIKRGGFRAHVDMSEHDTAEAAMAHTEAVLTAAVEEEARQQGARTVETRTERNDVWATVGDQRLFVEAVVTATATGRPELA